MIDFDRAIGDSNQPLRRLPALDSGDHLRSNKLGIQTLTKAIPLTLFRFSAANSPGLLVR